MALVTLCTTGPGLLFLGGFFVLAFLAWRKYRVYDLSGDNITCGELRWTRVFVVIVALAIVVAALWFVSACMWLTK